MLIKLGKASSVFLFFTLLFAGCDGGKSESENSELKEKVVIGRLICGGHLPLAVAEQNFQDDFSKFNLETVQNHDWDDVITDLKSGKLDGTFILSALALNLIKEGFPAKIVMKADRNGNGFILSKDIKSLNDLGNERVIIAVPHLYSQHNVIFDKLLEDKEISKDKITVIQMPPRDMINSLRRGEIDGFVVGEPEGNKSISMDVGWMAAISPTIWEDHLDHVFMVTDNFINNRPEELQELVDVLYKSGQYIEKNPHEAAILGENYTGSNAKIFEEVLTTPANWIDYSDMFPSDKDLQETAERLVKMKMWEKVPEDLSSYTDTRFISETLKKAK